MYLRNNGKNNINDTNNNKESMRNKISLESKEPKQWEGMRENEKMKNLNEGHQHFFSLNFSTLFILYIP